MGLLGGGNIFLGFGSRQAHLPDNLVRSGLDPAAIVAGLEPGQDRLADDDARHRVGQEHASAIAGLDADLMLVGRDEQDDPVVFAFLADGPRTSEAVAVILDRPAFEARDRRNDELPTRLGLKRFRLGGQVDDLFWAEQMRIVDDAPGQLRKILSRSRRGQREQRQPQDSEEAGHLSRWC